LQKHCDGSSFFSSFNSLKIMPCNSTNCSLGRAILLCIHWTILMCIHWTILMCIHWTIPVTYFYYLAYRANLRHREVRTRETQETSVLWLSKAKFSLFVLWRQAATAELHSSRSYPWRQTKVTDQHRKPACFPSGNNTGTDWTGWPQPIAILALMRKIIPDPCRDSKLDLPTRSLVRIKTILATNIMATRMGNWWTCWTSRHRI
jgi:hypothetical protein